MFEGEVLVSDTDKKCCIQPIPREDPDTKYVTVGVKPTLSVPSHSKVKSGVPQVLM